MRILIFLTMLLWGGAAMAQTAQVTDTANVNMRSGKAEAETASKSQAALEAAQRELVMVRVEMANLQRDLEKKQQQGPEGTASPLRFLLLVALGAFAAGMATGVLILKSYYHKRLHGLRI